MGNLLLALFQGYVWYIVTGRNVLKKARYVAAEVVGKFAQLLYLDKVAIFVLLIIQLALWTATALVERSVALMAVQRDVFFQNS